MTKPSITKNLSFPVKDCEYDQSNKIKQCHFFGLSQCLPEYLSQENDQNWQDLLNVIDRHFLNLLMKVYRTKIDLIPYRHFASSQLTLETIKKSIQKQYPTSIIEIYPNHLTWRDLPNIKTLNASDGPQLSRNATLGKQILDASLSVLVKVISKHVQQHPMALNGSTLLRHCKIILIDDRNNPFIQIERMIIFQSSPSAGP